MWTITLTVAVPVRVLVVGVRKFGRPGSHGVSFMSTVKGSEMAIPETWAANTTMRAHMPAAGDRTCRLAPRV